MASSVSSAVESSTLRIPPGVPPLRAGQGHSFFWRRLHSFSGIFPVGAFLIEHFISNAFASNGSGAYDENVRFLTGLPFVIWLEVAFIYLPLVYHAGYGLFIWWRGESNAGPSYPWTGNWMYTVQRYTGIVVMFYIGYHTWTMRFTGVHLMAHSDVAFAKVWTALQNPWVLTFYWVGLTLASWHFAYGIWLFAAKWGFVTAARGRKIFGVICLLIGLAMAGLATSSVYAFMTAPRSQVENLGKYERLANSPAPYVPQ